MSERLVLRGMPDLAAVSKYFESRGWTSVPDLPPPEQQSDDDRLFGIWQAPDGASVELAGDGYVCWLEFRDAEDHDRAAAIHALPCLDETAVSQLLASVDSHQLITGIRAARLLGGTPYAAALAALSRHPDESVRTEAAWALQEIVPDLIDHGMSLLRSQAARRQGANPLWSLLEPAWFRRQTLRWLLRDYPQPTPGVEATLRAALSDSDWEVRAGAMIGATRYRLRSLGGFVEQCELPRVSRNGPDAEDRALLRALKKVACALLAGQSPPELAEDASPKARALDRLAELLTAPPIAPDDHAGVFVHALTTPVEPSGEPVPLPTGVVEDETGWHLHGLRLTKVPFLLTGGGGFFIAEQPVANDEAPLALDSAGALDWCRRRFNGRLRLPAAGEWEIASRSNDRRLFPWGNGYQDDAIFTPGPWGTWAHGSMAEWALDSAGSPVRCGPRCAERQGADGVAHLRPVLRGI